MKNKKTIAVFPKGIDIQLTTNFSTSELDCKCNYASCNKTLIDLEHITLLQKLRDLVGPLKITSGFRCKRHNKNVGGVPTSQHIRGTATDIQSKRIEPNIIQATCDVIFNAVGSYDTFTHVDSRSGIKKRWDKTSK